MLASARLVSVRVQNLDRGIQETGTGLAISLTMAQTIHQLGPQGIESLEIPNASAKCVRRARWGRADVLFTPAFWAAQVFFAAITSASAPQRLGSDFREEVVACLLCTHGIPSEHGLAAFAAIRDAGLLSTTSPDLQAITEVLSEPICVMGKHIRYRFARQKSRAVHDAICKTRSEAPTGDPRELRIFLQHIHGIGPKIASWITRNYLASEKVAVIDIHVYRAGLLAAVMEPSCSISKDYERLELQYLEFANALNVRPSLLDNVIWQQMRFASHAGLL